MNFRFANPEYLVWLWLPIAGLAIFFLTEQMHRRRLSKNFDPAVIGMVAGTLATKKRILRQICLWLGLILAVLAWARPQAGKGQSQIKSRGIELVVALDVSNSMLTEDIRPSRLEVAKAELSRLFDLLPGDKVGLVAFAGSATLISPLTNDKSALKMFMESISPQSVESQGTSFQRALNEATGAFERGGVDSDEKTRVTRAVLVFSDGEDNEKGALEEARKLADNGVRIFTVAIGTENGGPIPNRDERGYLTGYKRDKSGKNILSTVHGDFLKEMAEIGKGGFYHLDFSGGQSKLIRADLDKLSKTEFQNDMITNYDEKFFYFLAPAIILLFVFLGLNERLAAGRLWRGRFEVPLP